MIELADVQAAARRLDGVAHHTPVFTSRTLDGLAGASVHVKAECFQRGGAFKFRGAFNKISSLGEDVRARGILAYSSGNHAQAVAIAAALLGSRATILMPEDAPVAKLEATRGYGALDDAPDLDVLVTPVGGGGLIAGCSTVAESLRPGICVVGVEPEAGDDTARSLAAGERVRIEVPRTIADGLQAVEPGELTFAVNRKRVDEVVSVSDAEIVDAMTFLFDRMKLVVEPSGAVGVAALLAGRVRGERIGVVVSGGNIGATRFAELLGG